MGKQPADKDKEPRAQPAKSGKPAPSGEAKPKAKARPASDAADAKAKEVPAEKPKPDLPPPG